MNLSEHFTLEELSFSEVAIRMGLYNIPGETQTGNLKLLCSTLLEPVRDLLGVPWHINSGYRAPAVNMRVGGAADSAHLEGRAADGVPIGMSLEEAFDKIRASDLPFDQIIFECKAWIHLAIARDGQPPRREALTAMGSPGHWSYQRVV